MNDFGKPTHFVRYRPLYVLALVGTVYKARGLLFDGAARSTFLHHLTGVSRQFIREWIREPFEQLCFELFRRLGTNDKLLVQLQELQAEEATLARMLRNFADILKADPAFSMTQLMSWPGAKVEAYDYDSDDLAMRYFENSMTNPLANMMQGHLTESCMVQSQRMKVLLYASLYSVDSVLMQLKWDFLMAGIMPFLTMCGMLYWFVSGIRRANSLHRRRVMLRALAEVDRYYNHHSNALAPLRSSGSYENLGDLQGQKLRDLLLAPPHPSMRRNMSGSSVLPSGGHFSPLVGQRRCSVDGELKVLELEKVGAALSHLDALCHIASVMRLEDVDWRAFRRDVLDLASPELSVAQKLHIIHMIRSTYDVFIRS